MSVGFEMRSPRKKCYYRGEYTKMKEMLREIRWGEEITGSTISEKFNHFREIMLEAEEECIPNGEGRNRQKKKPPWFNGEAKRSVRRKFFAYMRYRETGMYARYRIYVRERDKNKKVLRKARKTFEKKLYKEVKKTQRHCTGT